MRALTVLSMFFAGVVQAAALDVGNVAPGSGEIRLAFADESTSGPVLDYLEFERIERPPGPFEVVAFDPDNHVLAQATFEFEPTQEVPSMLVLIGNGSAETPYGLRLHDGSHDADMADETPARSAVALHHFAPFSGATAQEEFEAVASCNYLDADDSVSASARVLGYDQDAIRLLHGDGAYDCNLKTANPAFGSFDIEVPLVDGTLRFLLVGDGSHAPQRVLVLENGVVSQVVAESAPAVVAFTHSTAFWYDLTRPAQGVSLYELPGSDDVFGTWFTHDETGRPIWYLFNGVATGIPGQRDLVVQRPSRNGAVTRLGTAGSARLFYVDCNQAELRVFIGDRDYFTLRLRRSREVVSCEALD